jgi:hypothetical protein
MMHFDQIQLFRSAFVCSLRIQVERIHRNRAHLARCLHPLQNWEPRPNLRGSLNYLPAQLLPLAPLAPAVCACASVMYDPCFVLP